MSDFKLTLKRNWLWFLYALFVVTAMSQANKEAIFFSSGPYGAGKTLTWLLLLSFLFYSLRISLRENFFTSLKRMSPILWSRQVGLDLYIGLLLPLFIIYLNEGSILYMLMWLLPIFVFANLATLLYVALNYDSIIAHFVS